MTISKLKESIERVRRGGELDELSWVEKGGSVLLRDVLCGGGGYDKGGTNP